MTTLAWTLYHDNSTGMKYPKLHPTRVMVVDDHDQVREGLATFLSAFDDLTLVGTAADEEEAVSLCRDIQPDVILMDLVMPYTNGVDATVAIHRACPAAAIVVMADYGHHDMIAAALQAGAVAYLPKNVPAEELASTIRTARNGQHNTA